jgi:hypothetical protein
MAMATVVSFHADRFHSVDNRWCSTEININCHAKYAGYPALPRNHSKLTLGYSFDLLLFFFAMKKKTREKFRESNLIMHRQLVSN